MTPPFGPNLVGLPTASLASVAYALSPRQLQITGVREMNAPLFEMLDLAANLTEASEAFSKYMTAIFGLEPQQWRDAPKKNGASFRCSFVRLLLGWEHDSSSREAAVLKGWVQSRFGLPPAHHGEKIFDVSDPSWRAYVEDNMGSGYHENSIYAQLDLLYEYVQWVLRTMVSPSQNHLRLYRGVDRSSEQIIEGEGMSLLRVNSLCSFTTDRDTADCFGSLVVSVQAPLTKILFANTLLAFFPFRAEREVLLIGGDYPVTVEPATA